MNVTYLEFPICTLFLQIGCLRAFLSMVIEIQFGAALES